MSRPATNLAFVPTPIRRYGAEQRPRPGEVLVEIPFVVAVDYQPRRSSPRYSRYAMRNDDAVV
jgi:hypothetical protein